MSEYCNKCGAYVEYTNSDHLCSKCYRVVTDKKNMKRKAIQDEYDNYMKEYGDHEVRWEGFIVNTNNCEVCEINTEDTLYTFENKKIAEGWQKKKQPLLRFGHYAEIREVTYITVYRQRRLLSGQKYIDEYIEPILAPLPNP